MECPQEDCKFVLLKAIPFIFPPFWHYWSKYCEVTIIILCTYFLSHTLSGFQSNANLDIMKAGSVLRKATSRMWKGHRHYKLQDDCKTITYKSSWTLNSYSTSRYSPNMTKRGLLLFLCVPKTILAYCWISRDYFRSLWAPATYKQNI